MIIYVDADACPKPVKDILFKVALRLKVVVILVANQALQVPAAKIIKTVQVPGGFDVADQYIVDHVVAGDLVITADIPLADKIVDKGAHALNPRGEMYTHENIKQRLTMRNFMDELRGSGQNTGGPAPLNHKDRQQFANALDRFLANHLKT